MLFTIMSTITRWINKELEYRKTVYELGRLTSRDLRDLGIAQCDIQYIARHAADKKFAV
jgi:uncharacterized protein YjiS (DUF1127 family)